ncbi:MAG TPA: flippase-like domain-containing protein [Armatimonadetes bacterium]|nr:flippase-like domain-containing protein [Armatimonadota bacterium]
MNAQSEPKTPGSRSWRKRVGTVINGVLMGLVGAFLLKTVYENWAELRAYNWHRELNLSWLASSVALQMAALLLFALGWHAALYLLGAPIRVGHTVRIWITTNFLKYLPGKVWLPIGRALQAERHGVRKSVTLTSFFYEFLLFVSSGMLVAIATIPFWAQESSPRQYWAAYLCIPAALIVMHPAVFSPLSSLALRLLGRSPLTLRMPFGQMLLLLLCFCGAWFVFCSSFCLFVWAFHPLPPRLFPAIGGAFSFTLVLSLIAVFVPGGLGVREGLLIVLLSLYMSEGLATLISIGSRLWMILAEVCCWVVVMSVVRASREGRLSLRELRELKAQEAETETLKAPPKSPP